MVTSQHIGPGLVESMQTSADTESLHDAFDLRLTVFGHSVVSKTTVPSHASHQPWTILLIEHFNL